MYNSKEIIERIEKKFNDYSIDFKKFSQLLIEHKAFISGSFLRKINVIKPRVNSGRIQTHNIWYTSLLSVFPPRLSMCCNV